jgi:hypothetical protein
MYITKALINTPISERRLCTGFLKRGTQTESTSSVAGTRRDVKTVDPVTIR